jgi:hypothetical protein
MKKIFIFLIALSLFSPVLAIGGEDYIDIIKNKYKHEENYGDIVRYKYNPIEDWWKFRPNNSQLQYNSMTDKWTEVYPGEILRFNPAGDTWEYALPEKEIRYNLIKDQWFFDYFPPKEKIPVWKEKLTPISPVE